MAKRHSMRDGPLAALFKATERAEAAAEAYRKLAKEVLNGAAPREHA